jgi:predicted transposase YbfD/YdcC
MFCNQGTFYEDVYAMFDGKYMDEADKDGEYEVFSTIEKGHGRVEKRTCYVLNDIAYFTDYLVAWKGLSKIFAVKRVGKKSEETSCYLSSKNTTAENLLSYTRNHWLIEVLHHILDVTFGEDRCKMLFKKARFGIFALRKQAAPTLVRRVR